MKLMMICVAAAALAGCMRDPKPDDDDGAALMETSRAWSKVAQTRDLDAVAGYFADDAVIISAGQPPVRGKEAIRQSLEQAYNIPGFSNSWEPIEAKVSGDMGYLLERTRISMAGPDGAPITQTMQAVTIWRKSADGAWKNVVDISVPAPVAPEG
jgi:uncharacterized protein (TIGR02246 family)